MSKRILISAFNGIGDVVLLSPMIKAINYAGDFKVTLIGDNKYGPLNLYSKSSRIHDIAIVKTPKEAENFIEINQFDFYLCSINTTPTWFVNLLANHNRQNIFTHHYETKRKPLTIGGVFRYFYRKHWRVNCVSLLPSHHDIQNNFDL